MLPNFLIIGGNRCATTWTFQCLGEHPSIFTSAVKQIEFFDLNYEKGLDYYKNFFAQSSGSLTRGEASPSYLASEVCPKRIARDLPDVKLIATLRNPIDRAFSHYMIFKNEYEENTFEEAIENHPQLLTQGLYHEHLSRYYDFFDRKRICVLIFDDIRTDPLQFIRTIFSFLEVDESFVPPSLEKQINALLFPGLRQLIQAKGIRWIVELVKKTPVDPILRRLGKQRQSKTYPIMKNETREKLRQYFAVPNRKLAKLIDRDVTHWR